MSILKNNWHWMLFVLVIFGSIGVLIFTQLNTDAEPETVYNPPSEEIIQGIREKSDAQKVQDANDMKGPPPGASPNGHWHDGVWHKEPHAAPADTTTAPQILSELSEAEIKARVKALREQQLGEYRAKWGEDPSPDGSYQHFRDNHGNVVRHYRNTVVVSHYNLKTGFAPTPVQLQQYKQLRAALKDAASKENISEMQRLDNEIRSLVNAAQGEIPEPVGFGYYGDPISGEQEKNLNNKALRSFYQRMGVEHLYELYGERSY
ncbi:hypothetical protein J4G08_07200 [Candidatus Poribacteria bacterium]|nr:hypothetical protein [Candidatus Poribacteria bacterium]